MSYKTAENTTAYNDAGKPLTLEDKLSSMREDKAYSGFFKPAVKPDGTNTPTNNSGNNVPNNGAIMNSTEMMKQGRK